MSMNTGEVTKVIEAFGPVNPFLQYGNKTWRKAAETLLNEFGLERTLEFVERAVAVQGKPFSPTITNPWQLITRLGNLKIFYQKEEANQKLKESKKRPTIEGDPAYFDEHRKQWRVKSNAGIWVDYIGNQKPVYAE